jgi:glucosamine--fructose-6-phosphate aminotransferase (isomerizing)
MDKEIHEQPDVLRRLAAERSIGRLVQAIGDAREIFLIGCGSAHHAAQSGRYMLADAAGVLATAAPASEMALLYPSIGPNSLVIAFSQSGETIDILEGVREARSRGATICAIVNAEGSALDRFADLSIHLGCGPERCVLATKSYTAMLGVMHLVSHALAGDVDRGADELCDAALRLESLFEREHRCLHIRRTAQEIAESQHLFILGRHRNYPPALEAALKIKEVSYMHAEGFASGELKHGVIALVTNGTPCVILAPDQEYRKEALAAAAEVRARGALTIGISPREESEFVTTLCIAGSHSAPYEIAATTQLLAYQLARLRGCDPDRPRNLAKSVTVK